MLPLLIHLRYFAIAAQLAVILYVAGRMGPGVPIFVSRAFLISRTVGPTVPTLWTRRMARASRPTPLAEPSMSTRDPRATEEAGSREDGRESE